MPLIRAKGSASSSKMEEAITSPTCSMPPAIQKEQALLDWIMTPNPEKLAMAVKWRAQMTGRTIEQLQETVRALQPKATALRQECLSNPPQWTLETLLRGLNEVDELDAMLDGATAALRQKGARYADCSANGGKWAIGSMPMRLTEGTLSEF